MSKRLQKNLNLLLMKMVGIFVKYGFVAQIKLIANKNKFELGIYIFESRLQIMFLYSKLLL